jgi:3-hydroxyisobutyrate dehydrogenase-like beta-hydroxyacid dehydrogenase
MGGAMARRLIDGGFNVICFDIDPDKTAAMAELGAKIAESPRSVADYAEIVLACLPTEEASRTVSSGIAQGRVTKVYVETSTIGQRTILSIADELGKQGIATLDMPVSGGPSWAREGRLTGILSGPADARAQAAAVLNCIAGRVIVVGDIPGQGQIAKIVNNMLSLSGMMIACEAIVAGVKAGVDAEKLLEVINAGTGRNSATVDKFPKAILPRTFNYGGPIGLGIKDLSLYLDLNPIPIAGGSLGVKVMDLWERITDDLGENADLSEMVRYFEKRAGVEVRGNSSSLGKHST